MKIRRSSWQQLLGPTTTSSVTEDIHGKSPPPMMSNKKRKIDLGILNNSPGRFFAINEMKLLFSLLLLRYDFKLAPGDEPKPFYIATMFIPDTTLKVQFKARTNGN